MVEINNQRKAFLDMLAWSEGTDKRRQKTRNHGYDVIVGEESYLLITPITSQTCHAKPKTQINRRRTLPASFPLVGCHRKQLGWKTSLRKVRTLWHCSRLRAWRLYLWLIVVISVRQSTVAAISGLHCRALVMVGSSIRLTAWLQNSKKRAGTVREIDVWAESPRLSPLWLSASSSACHGLLIITVITPMPTKPSATKMPENWSWRTRQLLTCRCVSVMFAALDAKYTKVKLMLKLKMMLTAWWCCRWSSSVAHQSSLSVSTVKPPPPPAWIMQPPG